MHINLNGKQRSYDYLSIHSTQNTISGEYNNHKEKQYPSIFIVSIAGDQNAFYLQIKEYPFALLVLEIKPEFRKTSCFLPFHPCFPSGISGKGLSDKLILSMMPHALQRHSSAHPGLLHGAIPYAQRS